MIAPLEFYIKEKSILEQKFSLLKKKLFFLSLLRLVLFFALCFFTYRTLGIFPNVIIIVSLGIIFFTFLILKYVNLKRASNIIATKIDINTLEIEILQGNSLNLDSGKEFINPSHFYSNDIDLFGTGSFFQYTNRTATEKGKNALANILTENTTDFILEKQKAINELSKKVHWRQHFSALANLAKTKKGSSSFVVKWILNYTTVFPSFLGLIPVIFSTTSLILIALTSFKIISPSLLFGWFVIGLFSTGIFLKKIQKLYINTTKVGEIFKQYHQLLNQIEIEKFNSNILKEKQQIICSETKKAATIFKEFSKILDAFDQRNNIIIALIGNGLFLWDINNACKIERWICTYHHTIEKWFEVVAFFDAQNSLANFKFNHPSFIFPKIGSENEIIESSQLGHPLLDNKKRIDNDFSIHESQFFIVTGANMAGKSTFLRTVSLAIVMANCGLPVCARTFCYTPIKLITSMRTSDSLTNDESYFYSELKRLKLIIDAIKREKYFIVLDEILKGTNSKDKAVGSKKFVEKLSISKSTGIIATHDISLCKLAENHQEIKNYYFDATVINNELFFDYSLKNGICKNMNASFLLEKMKII